jgi:hypothetical protein
MPQNAKILTVLRLIATVLNATGILMAVVQIANGLSLGASLMLAALPLLNIFCIWSPILTFLRPVAIILNAIWIVGQVLHSDYVFSGLMPFVIWFVISFGFPLLNIFCIWFRPKKAGKPYVDAGLAITHALAIKFNLPDWDASCLPNYTKEEIDAINRRASQFQGMADETLGGEARFHSEVIPDIQRMLAGEALAELAGDVWKYSDELPKNWKQCVSTYLKAWASSLSPLVLLDLGNLLARAGSLTEAKETFEVVLLFPSYADTYYGKHQKSGLVKSITDSAKVSLRELA